MNRSDIEKFICAAETGSMAKAAEKLYISQPAISKAIRKIEDELGEQLILRNPGGITLTFAGKTFLQRAYQLDQLYNNINLEFCELNQMRKGNLTFGITPRLGAIIIPDIIRSFRSKFPNITINLIEKDASQLEEQILEGKVEMAVVPLPLTHEHIQQKIFYRDPFLIAVPKNHPLNEKGYRKEGEILPFMDIQDLRGQTFVLTTKARKTRYQTEKILERIDHDYVTALESANMETVIRLVAEDMGITIIPATFAKLYGDTERICYYRVEEEYEIYHDWAMIYTCAEEELSRPSRELYHMICKEGVSPDYIG